MMRKLRLSTLPELVRAARLLEIARDSIHSVDDTVSPDLCASSRQSKAAHGTASFVR